MKAPDTSLATARNEGQVLSGERPALSAAARRALEEAEARRRCACLTPATEIGGRDGLDPVRYGDWEVKGLASDF